MTTIYASPADDRDAVLLLREWGTDRFKLLPQGTYSEWLIGVSPECVFRLIDRLAAPKHAQVTRDGERWWIRDLGTATGLRRNGMPGREFVLSPGDEIQVGATVLVAESARAAKLREYVQRLLGWSSGCMPAVDHALRVIRLAGAHRSPLVLRGHGDVVAVAQALQRVALGEHAPFVLCNPRRGNGDASVRAPANLVCSADALVSAAGGSVCVLRERLPADFPELARRTLAADSTVRLVVCAGPDGRITPDARAEAIVTSMTIEIPSLKDRTNELLRVVDEYACDAIAAQRAPHDCFTATDLSWVIEESAETLPEIEKGTARVVAIKSSASTYEAAERLGMSHVSLERWFARRAALPSKRPRAARRSEAASRPKAGAA